MAISIKYGKINITGIREDEPIFILRAQDILAESTIKSYKALAIAYGQNDLAKDVSNEVGRFNSWDGPRKLPD